jgi:hypothetical protein
MEEDFKIKFAKHILSMLPHEWKDVEPSTQLRLIEEAIHFLNSL